MLDDNLRNCNRFFLLK